ncbi:MAG: hypothetical protein V4735_04935 [Pseudomonadota bacterium]
MGKKRNPQTNTDSNEDEEVADKTDKAWNIFGKLWDMISFDNIFMLLIAGFLAYTFAQSSWGQDLIKKGIEMLPEGLQAKLLDAFETVGVPIDMNAALSALAAKDMNALREKMIKNKVPEEVVGIIAKDKATFDGFLKTVSDANDERDPKTNAVTSKGRVNLKTFTNANTIFALMTQQPDTVQQLAAAVLKPGSTAAKSPTAEAMMASLKEIVNGPKLDVLLNDANRENTLKLIMRVMPENVPLQADALSKLIRDGIGADGKATDGLRKSLVAALNNDANTLLATVIADKPVSELLKLVDTSKLSDGLEKSCISAAQKNPQLVTAIETALGKAEAAKFLIALRCENPAEMLVRLAISPENIHALPHIAAFVNTVPELKTKLPVDLNAFSQFIQTTGMGADGRPGEALKTALTAIGKIQPLTAEALQAPITEYVLSPEVAKNPKSVAAIKTFLESTNLAELPPAMRAKLTLLKTKLTAETLPALSAINANGVDPFKLLGAFVDDGSDKPSKIRAMGILLNSGARASVEKAGTANLAILARSEAPFLNKQNIDALLAFGKETATNPANQGDNGERTVNVLTAFIRASEGVPAKDAFAQVDAKALSGFFAVPGNHNALLNLMKSMDRSVLTADQAKLMATLDKDLGDFTNRGLTNLLADEKSAAYIIDKIKSGPGSGLGDIAWVRDAALRLEGGRIAANRDVIADVMALLSNSNVTAANSNQPAAGVAPGTTAFTSFRNPMAPAQRAN